MNANYHVKESTERGDQMQGANAAPPGNGMRLCTGEGAGPPREGPPHLPGARM
jgi:hypothetical protein